MGETELSEPLPVVVRQAARVAHGQRGDEPGTFATQRLDDVIGNAAAQRVQTTRRPESQRSIAGQHHALHVGSGHQRATRLVGVAGIHRPRPRAKAHREPPHLAGSQAAPAAIPVERDPPRGQRIGHFLGRPDHAFDVGREARAVLAELAQADDADVEADRRAVEGGWRTTIHRGLAVHRAEPGAEGEGRKPRQRHAEGVAA